MIMMINMKHVMRLKEHTCLSIWFSFCKVESFSSSSEFFCSKSLTLTSKSLKYAFFLSLACCAETLFLNNLLFCTQKRQFHQNANEHTQSTKKGRTVKSPWTRGSPTHLFSLLLSLSAGLLPLFLCPSPTTWARSGPANEPVSLPEIDAPADSPPISGTLLISSSLSMPKI